MGKWDFLDKIPSGLLTYPEEGGSKIVRNICKLYRTTRQHNQENLNRENIHENVTFHMELEIYV